MVLKGYKQGFWWKLRKGLHFLSGLKQGSTEAAAQKQRPEVNTKQKLSGAPRNASRAVDFLRMWNVEFESDSTGTCLTFS